MAYYLHTTGTTGEPKLVRVPHCCVVPNVVDLRQRFAMSADDVVFNAAPLTFDPSVVEVYHISPSLRDFVDSFYFSVDIPCLVIWGVSFDGSGKSQAIATFSFKSALQEAVCISGAGNSIAGEAAAREGHC